VTPNHQRPCHQRQHREPEENPGENVCKPLQARSSQSAKRKRPRGGGLSLALDGPREARVARKSLPKDLPRMRIGRNCATASLRWRANGGGRQLSGSMPGKAAPVKKAPGNGTCPRVSRSLDANDFVIR
jgi:hypothetical protein